MILELFAFFVALSLILIYIGLTRPTESAQAIIGFLFLFLLSLVVLGNNLEYKVGEQTNTTYIYSVANGSQINLTIEDKALVYTPYNDTTGIFNTHRLGYFMAVASAVGLIGVLVSLKGGWRNE